MPGITIIGDSRNAARSRPTSLPAEARSLSRFLRLLKCPETASEALLKSLEALSEPSGSMQGTALQNLQQKVADSVHELREAGWDTFADRYAEYSMALAVETVMRDPSSFEAPRKPAHGRAQKNRSMAANLQKGGNSISDDSSRIIPTNRKTSPNQSAPSSPLSDSSPRGMTMADVKKRQAVVVSDSSSIELSEVGEEEEEADGAAIEVRTQKQTDLELSRSTAAKYLWAIILESLHLQIASRTTTVWGRKKIYEVYQLGRPVQSTTPQQLSALRERLEKECRSIFEGTLSDASDCRVYTTLQTLHISDESHTQALYVQFNLGKTMDLQDESNRSKSGEKKKKAGREYVAVLIPGISLFCLTASRAPSRSRFTPNVLAALENILTETTNNYAAMKATNGELKDLVVKRFGDLSGTEPQELFRSARSLSTGEAVGRFAYMAALDQSNPIHDLQTAATANLLCTDNISETTRLHVGAKHAGNANVTQKAAQVAAAAEGGATLVAANQSATNIWVDHSMKQRKSRKRFREEALGRAKDCPSLQRVCWKWSGQTTAASACWVRTDDTSNAVTNEELPQSEFKCAVVMHGENVLQGLQALVDAGLAEAPLPDFIRNAPSMGGTVRVDHGSFVPGDTPFEAV